MLCFGTAKSASFADSRLIKFLYKKLLKLFTKNLYDDGRYMLSIRYVLRHEQDL